MDPSIYIYINSSTKINTKYILLKLTQSDKIIYQRA